MSLPYVPPAPREPSREAEALLFSDRSHLAPLSFGGLFFAFGMLFVVVFCWGLPKDVALSIAGTDINGTVIDAGPDERVRINGRHPTKIRFRYTWEGVDGEGQSSALDLEVEPGLLVPLTVLPAEPAWVRMKGTTASPFGYGGLIATIFPAIGLGVMWVGWREIRRRRRAYTHGEVTIARVNEVVDGPPKARVHWSFDVDGKPFSGSIEARERAALEALIHGDRIAVVYDPEDPSSNVPWVA